MLANVLWVKNDDKRTPLRREGLMEAARQRKVVASVGMLGVAGALAYFATKSNEGDKLINKLKV